MPRREGHTIQPSRAQRRRAAIHGARIAARQAQLRAQRKRREARDAQRKASRSPATFEVAESLGARP